MLLHVTFAGEGRAPPPIRRGRRIRATPVALPEPTHTARRRRALERPDDDRCPPSSVDRCAKGGCLCLS